MECAPSSVAEPRRRPSRPRTMRLLVSLSESGFHSIRDRQLVKPPATQVGGDTPVLWRTSVSQSGVCHACTEVRQRGRSAPARDLRSAQCLHDRAPARPVGPSTAALIRSSMRPLGPVDIRSQPATSSLVVAASQNVTVFGGDAITRTCGSPPMYRAG